MSTILKSAVLGLGLLIGAAGALCAQTTDQLSALPPQSAAPAAPAAPMGPATFEVVRPTGVSPQYVGPDPGRGAYPAEKQTRAVEPSPVHPGPALDSGTVGDE